MDSSKKWWALVVLCLGQLMIVLDTTIVNVALPSIRVDLGFSEVSLAWVVNAYMLAFGGFLLLGGRLGDLFGHRKLFLSGIGLFTLASLACGFAQSQWFLISARAAQGLGGAFLAAVALSLMMNLFKQPAERAKAMGYFGFVSAGGGSIGVLLGGLLTGSFNWHWIFLVNIPIGILVFIAGLILLPTSPRDVESARHLDVFGALSITSGLMLAVYAIVNGNNLGWTSFATLSKLGGAIILHIIFIIIELNVKSPLVPLSLFKFRNITVSNLIGVLWAAGMFSWFFLSALYLQLVLHYTPLKVGLSFLPSNLIMAAFSLGLSAKIVLKFGIKKPLSIGLFLAASGLALLARAPIDGQYIYHVFPSMLLLGIGAGMAFNPMLLAAMSDAPENESGLASGLVNTSFMMGGALGLAVLASIAAMKTKAVIVLGVEPINALVSGYHTAFIVGTLFAALGATLAATILREPKASSSNQIHSGI
jgi:EmrB/QacA subfamily drug resistance transporter